MNSKERFMRVVDTITASSEVEDEYERRAYEWVAVPLFKPLWFYTRRGVRENLKNHIYENSFSRCRSKIDEPTHVMLEFVKSENGE